ncbi:MAG: SRPBCC domain-containing protein [Niastella sp.]|nr:SRPBCC domain-containing protein [Niastella sp.]
MNTRLQFDFQVNRADNTLRLIREFLAERPLVWDCYTKSDLLDQWFAPKPMSTLTRSMEFKEGGHWHYAMVDVEGNKYWGLTKYVEIKPIDYYTAVDAFSNEQGEINNNLPRARWKVEFSESGGNTIVHTRVQYNSLADLESVIEMGMQEGMRLTLEKLDELLSTF